jgi:hypothetical protein
MSALGQIHAAARDLGLDDDTKRAVYQRVTGKHSAADMDEGERRAVVDELRRQGASKGGQKRRKALSGPYAKKLQALWIAGWNLGLMRNRDDKALLAFVKRQTGLDHTRFLHHHDDATKAIEALKGWLARDGGVDWTVGDHLQDWARAPGYKIARAQFALLKAQSPDFGEFNSLHHWLVQTRRDRPGMTTDPAGLRKSDWMIVMNGLGERVRDMKAGA